MNFGFAILLTFLLVMCSAVVVCISAFVYDAYDERKQKMKMNRRIKVVRKNDTVVFDPSIEDIGLTLGAYSCLRRAGYTKVRDILSFTEDDFLKVKGMDAESANNSFEKLNIYLAKLKDKIVP